MSEMTDINETIADVLRLEAAASGRKVWEARMVCPRGGWSDDDDEFIDSDGWWIDGPEWLDYADASFFHQADATLIAYYRTAAPALAREVQRLQDMVRGIQRSHECDLVAAYESGRRAGQEAALKEAAKKCDERMESHRKKRIRCGPGKRFGKLQVAEDEAFACAADIRTLRA
jgi:hypothetical protein